MTVSDYDVIDDIGALDESYWSEYQNAATRLGTPPPGKYTLRFPDDLPDSAFVIQNDPLKPSEIRPNINGGKPYLEITLDNGLRGEQGQGCTIVGGEYDGVQVRFLRVDTRRIPEYKQGKPTGTLLKETTAADVLQNFGTRDAITSVDDWKAAFRRLCGQETPNPVSLTWSAYDKNAQGKEKYVKRFPKGQSYIERTAKTSFVTKKGDVVAEGDTYRVYANLSLGYRGFSPRS